MRNLKDKRFNYIYVFNYYIFFKIFNREKRRRTTVLAAAFLETKPRMRSSCKHGQLIVGNQIARHCAIVSGVVSVHVVDHLGQPDTELFRIPSHKRAPTS